MGLRYPNQKCNNCFFITTTFSDWQRLGEVKGIYKILEENLVFYANKYDAAIAAYVLMPSHLHMLFFIDGERLANFMRDYKKYISQHCLKTVGIAEKGIWISGYDRVAVVSEKIFRNKLNYIHYNPVKAGLCINPEDWPWSSASYYLRGEPCRIPIWSGWSIG